MSSYDGTTPPPPPGDDFGRDSGSYAQTPPPAPGYGQGATNYTAAPGYANAPAPAAPVSMTRPSTIDRAVLLMRVGAVVSLLSLLSTFIMKDAMRDLITTRLRAQGLDPSPAGVSAALNLGIGIGVVSGLVGVGLWLWMAHANGKGKKWARIVATIFFAFSVLNFLASFMQAAPLVTHALSLLIVLVGAAAIYFMYRKESTAYYEAMSAPRI